MLKCHEQVFFFFGELWHIGDEKKGRWEGYKGHFWGKNYAQVIILRGKIF
jgi:hypothetical protein